MHVYIIHVYIQTHIKYIEDIYACVHDMCVHIYLYMYIIYACVYNVCMYVRIYTHTYIIYIIYSEMTRRCAYI
jgi:hypothetical protein